MALILDNTTIDYDQISLGIPNQLQRNIYFSRIFLNDNPIYIQTNECFTSTGIKETNTKSYCDLIYINNDTIVNFFTSLEKKIKECVLANKEDWFEDNFTSDDLDDSFISSIGYHKQGIKLRTYIHKNAITENYNLNCYDYNHELISNNKLCVGINLIPIIEIVGIRFTDKSFHIEIKLVQSLLTDMEVNNNDSKSMFINSINNESVIKQKIEYNTLVNNKNSELDFEETEKIAIERNADEEAEAKIKADEEAEAKRKADEEAEAKRKADEEAEAKRKADEEAEAKRKADEEAEAKRKADEEAEAKRKADEEAEAKRKADEELKDKLDINNLENIKDCIEEIDLYNNITDDIPVKLKTHEDIYKEIWKMYREDIFRVRQQNIKFMLNSRNIHTNYLINEI